MLSKENRRKIGEEVFKRAKATNASLPQPHCKNVLITYAWQRADAVISALNIALKKAYSDVTPEQLLLAKHKLDAKEGGNREARRKAKVAANRDARNLKVAEKKLLRIEERKNAALLKKAAEIEEESD